MPMFRLVIFGEIGDHGDRFFLISEFMGLGGLLRLGYVWAFVWLPVYLVVVTVICFERFSCLFREIGFRLRWSGGQR